MDDENKLDIINNYEGPNGGIILNFKKACRSQNKSIASTNYFFHDLY